MKSCTTTYDPDLQNLSFTERTMNPRRAKKRWDKFHIIQNKKNKNVYCLYKVNTEQLNEKDDRREQRGNNT